MVIILLIITSILSLWPLVANIETVVVDKQDSILVLWILNQHVFKLVELDFLNIFESNIFYPAKLTMVYTSLLIPSGVISSIVRIFTDSHIAVLNFSLISSQVFTFLVLYLFLLDFSKNKISSFLATLAFGLSTIRFGYLVHLQVWSLEWFLLSFWFVWKFRKYQKLRYLYLASLFLVIQAWQNMIQLYWLFFIFLFLFVDKINLLRKNIKHIFISGLLVITFVSPVIYAYLSVKHLNGFERSIRDAAHFSASVDDLYKRFLSPNLILMFLYSLKNFHKTKFKYYLFAGFVLVISLGPVLKLAGQTVRFFNFPIPLPYFVLYYVVPGLSALRTPSRWLLLFAVLLSLIIAKNLNYLNMKKHKLEITLLMLVAFFGGTRLRGVHNFNTNIPDAYKYIENFENANVVVELPFYTWHEQGGIEIEVQRMYYSLYHKRNTLNGYSGFFPESWVKIKKAQTENILLLPKLLSEYSADIVLVAKRDKKYIEIFNDSELYGEIYQDGEYLLFKHVP